MFLPFFFFCPVWLMPPVFPSDTAVCECAVVLPEAEVSENSAESVEAAWRKAAGGHDRKAQRAAADAREAYWNRMLSEYEAGLDVAMERFIQEWKAGGDLAAEDEAALRASMSQVRQSWRRYAEAEDALVRRLPVPEGCDAAAYAAGCRAAVVMQHVVALHAHAAFSLKDSFVFGEGEETDKWSGGDVPVMEMPRDDYARHLARLRDEAGTMSWMNALAENVAEYWDERLLLFLDALPVGLYNNPHPELEGFPEDAVKTAQEAWLAYRDFMIASLAPLPRYVGTGTPTLRAILRERLTRQRCENFLFYAGTGDPVSAAGFIPYTRHRQVLRR